MKKLIHYKIYPVNPACPLGINPVKELKKRNEPKLSLDSGLLALIYFTKRTQNLSRRNAMKTDVKQT